MSWDGPEPEARPSGLREFGERLSRSAKKAPMALGGTGSPGGMFRCSRTGSTHWPFLCNP